MFTFNQIVNIVFGVVVAAVLSILFTEAFYVLHSLRESLGAAERQIHLLSSRVSKQDQDITDLNLKIEDLNEYISEQVDDHNAKIEDLNLDKADTKLILDTLRKENYEIYDCIGLIDKRVVKMNDKLKTRARKRDIMHLNECIDDLCKQLYVGK